MNTRSLCLVRLLLVWPEEPRKLYSCLKQRLCIGQDNSTDFASLNFAFTLSDQTNVLVGLSYLVNVLLLRLLGLTGHVLFLLLKLFGLIYIRKRCHGVTNLLAAYGIVYLLSGFSGAERMRSSRAFPFTGFVRIGL